MKRFRTVTAMCLAAVALLAIANVWYLHGLYSELKEQTMVSARECVRRADLLEMISRLRKAYGVDDSFLQLTLRVYGEKDQNGNYCYPEITKKVTEAFSTGMHLGFSDESPELRPDFAALDSLVRAEMDAAGLHPAEISVASYPSPQPPSGQWQLDYAPASLDNPIYTVSFSSLGRQVLAQMGGIIATSAAIWLVMGFLVWYLLRWVGRLRSIEEMKDDFTHNMTHELKTPVAVAYSAADSMLRYYDHSDEVRNKRLLNIILQRLSYLSGMIENILSMSMERFRSIKLQMADVAVAPTLEEIAGLIKMKADKPVNISVKVADRNLTLRADPLHFGNVVSNLLDNAVKYSGESVDIVIRADYRGLSVEDNGIGISREHLPHVFDKFYRVADGDRYSTSGYGLGLFYVKQITVLMGWSIRADSKPGAGSKFTIIFNDNEKGQDTAG